MSTKENMKSLDSTNNTVCNINEMTDENLASYNVDDRINLLKKEMKQRPKSSSYYQSKTRISSSSGLRGTRYGSNLVSRPTTAVSRKSQGSMAQNRPRERPLSNIYQSFQNLKP